MDIDKAKMVHNIHF